MMLVLAAMLLIVLLMAAAMAMAVALGVSLVVRITQSTVLSTLAAAAIVTGLVLVMAPVASPEKVDAPPPLAVERPDPPVPASEPSETAPAVKTPDLEKSKSTLRIVLKALLNAVDEVEAQGTGGKAESGKRKADEKPASAVAAPALTKIVETKPVVQPAAVQDRPSWVGTSAKREGGDYVMPVTVGPYLTEAECESKLPDELKKAVDSYISDYLHLKLDARNREKVSLPWEYVEDHLIRQRWLEHKQFSVGPMVQLHVQLAFDHAANQRIRAAWGQVVTEDRIRALGGLGIVSLLVLSVCWGLLRLGTPK